MSYSGMNAETGRWLSGLDHVRQSVAKIFTTQIGTRVQRRRFGSVAAGLIDQPGNQATILRVYAAAATAVMAWEPRVRVNAVSATADPASPGRYQITIAGVADVDGQVQPFSVSAPVGI
ncbi:Lysozyme [compost metagenome]